MIQIVKGSWEAIRYKKCRKCSTISNILDFNIVCPSCGTEAWDYHKIVFRRVVIWKRYLGFIWWPIEKMEERK